MKAGPGGGAAPVCYAERMVKRPLEDPLRKLGRRLRKGLSEASAATKALTRPEPAPLAEGAPEPPVVARLMVEIRSDGSRTIARGALEDVASGERVGVHVRGSTPAQLAGSLARAVFTAPMLARQAARALQKARRDAEGE